MSLSISIAMTAVTQRAAGGHEANANLNVAPPAVDATPRISNNTRRAILFRSRVRQTSVCRHESGYDDKLKFVGQSRNTSPSLRVILRK
jgi:hypothetical protein